MTALEFSTFSLQARLWLARRGTPALLGALLCAAGAGAWLWQAPQARVQRALALLPPPSDSKPVSLVAAPPSADQNLADFYDTLGERRYVEQQLKTLFALAGKNGITLSAGQYKAAQDQGGHFHTYQIVLPVKGSYPAVWQFCLQTLAAIPFAALDEVSFRRDAVGDATLDARLRFTLYLTDGAATR